MGGGYLVLKMKGLIQARGFEITLFLLKKNILPLYLSQLYKLWQKIILKNLLMMAQR